MFVGPRPVDPDNSPHAPTEISAPPTYSPGWDQAGPRRSPSTTSESRVLHTWSTAELVVQRRRFRVFWISAPVDRSRDMTSLESARAELLDQLGVLDGRHDELSREHRTWRERRRGPNHELLVVESRQRDISQRLGTIEHDLESARTTTQGHEAFMMEHEPDVLRLSQIDEVLSDRVDPRGAPGNKRTAGLPRTLPYSGPLPTGSEPVDA